MQEHLKDILNIQELDIKMIRLMQMKHARNKELSEIESIHDELVKQMHEKQDDLKPCTTCPFLDWLVRYKLVCLQYKRWHISSPLGEIHNSLTTVPNMEDF